MPRSPEAAELDAARDERYTEVLEPSERPERSGRQFAEPARVRGPAILEDVGFNPHRIHRRRPSDYVFVVAAVVAGLLLLTWALAG